MKIVKASSEDSQKLIDYFTQTSLPGDTIDLRFHRKNNFFKQYDIQSKDHVTYYLEDIENGKIEALVSLVFRKGIINGSEQVIGYATDLRVSKSRKAIMQWAQKFLPALQKERDKRNCQYIFSVVANEQRQAYNTFIRPRSPKRKMPRYYPYRRFETISVHGILPWAPKPLAGIIIKTGTLEKADQVAEYILKKKKELSFYFGNSKEEILQQISQWHELNINKFLIAEDTQGNIIGCTAPWSNWNIQCIYPTFKDTTTLSLVESLNLLSYLGISHKIHLKGEPLYARFLTYYYSDNPDIFYSLLYHSFKALTKDEFLLYTHFEGDLKTLPPKGFLTTKTKCGLYCILAPNEELPDFLKPSYLNEAPDFELAFT